MLAARSAGFLWVISLLSTLRRPLVTSSPRLRSANTAATPPAAGAAAAVTGGGGGPGGGGGGGGALLAPADVPLDSYWSVVMPYTQK